MQNLIIGKLLQQSSNMYYEGKPRAYAEYENDPRHAQRAKRVRDCGRTTQWYVNPVTAESRYQTFYCGHWRECEHCAKRRRNDHLRSYQEINKEFENAELYLIHEVDAKRITSKCGGREHYLRVPYVHGHGEQAVEMVAIFVDKPIKEEHVPINVYCERSPLKEVDLEQLANALALTPQRKRVSGNLWKLYDSSEEEEEEKEVEETETTGTFKIPHLKIDATKDEIHEMYEIALKTVLERDPFGFLSSKAKVYMRAYNEFLEEMIMIAENKGFYPQILFFRNVNIDTSEIQQRAGQRFVQMSKRIANQYGSSETLVRGST